MSRIFITGSSSGLGFMTAQMLADAGHEVVLHARSHSRAEETKSALGEARGIAVGDLSRIADIRDVADQANRMGPYDSVIHNAGVGFRERHQVTDDGLPHLFSINVLAPYMLTALIKRPRQLVYLSSAMHFGGELRLDDLLWQRRAWHPAAAYSESKLYDVMLALAIARRWRDVASNAMTPGWVPTRMGGPGAPDDMDQACLTQIWLATDPEAARLTGGYYYHLRRQAPNPDATDTAAQDQLVSLCEKISGVALPS